MKLACFAENLICMAWDLSSLYKFFVRDVETLEGKEQTKFRCMYCILKGQTKKKIIFSLSRPEQ